MKKIFLLLITAVVLSPSIMAQEANSVKKNKKEERKLRISAIAKQEEEGVVKYKKHTLFGVKLTTDGYGFFFEMERAKSVKKALLFQLDIAERKHTKEAKLQSADIYSSSSPIIYGKLNFFYPVKLGVQEQFLLGNKGNKNGVGLTGNVGGGISLALLRPYMVDVVDNDGSGNHRYVTYDPNDSLSGFLTKDRFVSGPNIGTGWSKLKLTPGLYVKAGARFDFGKYNEMVNALEVGVAAEYYSKKIPQMAFNKQKQFFFSAYVSIMFGKRK